MTVPTMNEDEFHGDDGKSPDQVLREVEQMAADMALGDPAVEHEDRPWGYGELLKTYEWRPYPVPAGCADEVRSWCLTDGVWMVLGMRVDPRYGKTQNKNTRGPYAVEYTGRPVQAWICPGECKQWVTK